jgi:nucleoside phosphorylase
MALRHADYKVGWICALPVEGAAAVAMLDETHSPLPQAPSDDNSYILGRIGHHNVVIACLPLGRTGAHNAAAVACHMKRSFTALTINLLVGIGGGAPSEEHDIRLGDVVVSQPGLRDGGVVQYDFGKTVENGEFTYTNTVDSTPPALLATLGTMQIRNYMEGNTWGRHLARLPTHKFTNPGPDYDLLFQYDYDHVGRSDCERCDPLKLVKRETRTSTDPVVHYGTIMSANRVMRHGATRERLRQQFNALCFEMEAAGLMNHFRCAVIRGICDYADTHKRKRWQPYAAATAAAYAKELLLLMPPERGPHAYYRAKDKSQDHPPSTVTLIETRGSIVFYTSPRMPIRMITILEYIHDLIHIISWLVAVLRQSGGSEQVATKIANRLNQRNESLQKIFALLGQTHIKEQVQLDQTIEDKLSDLHQSLVKSYRRGVVLNLFTGNGSQTALRTWDSMEITHFLEGYDEWVKTICTRLRVVDIQAFLNVTSTEVERENSASRLDDSKPREVRCATLPCCSSIFRSELHMSSAMAPFHYEDLMTTDHSSFPNLEGDAVATGRVRQRTERNDYSVPQYTALYHDIPHQRYGLVYDLPCNYERPRSIGESVMNFEGTRSHNALPNLMERHDPGVKRKSRVSGRILAVMLTAAFATLLICLLSEALGDFVAVSNQISRSC